MNFLKKLEKKGWISKKPKPHLPFLTALAYLLIWVVTNNFNNQFQTQILFGITKIIFYIFMISLIHAITHLIIYLKLK